MAQLGYAGFHVLMMILGIALTWLMFIDIGSSVDEPPFFALFCWLLILGGIIQILMTIPSWIAGYALLTRRRWARVVGMVASAGAYLSFPVGSLVAAYTFLFLFSDAGKEFYGVSTRARPEEWQANDSSLQGT